jgi:hypothetical protein
MEDVFGQLHLGFAEGYLMLLLSSVDYKITASSNQMQSFDTRKRHSVSMINPVSFECVLS